MHPREAKSPGCENTCVGMCIAVLSVVTRDESQWWMTMTGKWLRNKSHFDRVGYYTVTRKTELTERGCLAYTASKEKDAKNHMQ